MTDDEVKRYIIEAMADAEAVFKADRNPFDAGRYDAFKQVVEWLEKGRK